MPKEIAEVAPLAKKCALAYVKTLETGTDLGDLAYDTFTDLVWEKNVKIEPISFDKKENTTYVLVLPAKKTSSIESVNYSLIQSGCARFDGSGYDLPEDFV